MFVNDEALLLRLPIGRGGNINSPRSVFLLFSVSQVGVSTLFHAADLDPVLAPTAAHPKCVSYYYSLHAF